MKKITAIAIFFVLAVCRISAQDSLLLIDRSIIECKTISISNTEIAYTLWGTDGKNNYAIKKSLVHMILYHSGHRDTITPIEIADISTPSNKRIRDLGGNNSDTSTYVQGFQDGFENQDDLVPALLGGAAGLGCGICGVIAPIIVNTSTIPVSKLPVEVQTKRSPKYLNGYIDGASKKRSRAVWVGYAIGLVVPSAVLIYLNFY